MCILRKGHKLHILAKYVTMEFSAISFLSGRDTNPKATRCGWVIVTHRWDIAAVRYSLFAEKRLIKTTRRRSVRDYKRIVHCPAKHVHLIGLKGATTYRRDQITYPLIQKSSLFMAGIGG